jgi:hypothetical protein
MLPAMNQQEHITEASAERAVYFLRDTAEKYGASRGHMAFADANLRRVKSLQMLAETEGSVADREAKAYASNAYLDAIVQLKDATTDYEVLRAQREASQFAIEFWRSLNSARKQGVNL